MSLFTSQSEFCLGVFGFLFLKGIGGGAGSNFAFPLVEINQSWESKLLAVKMPGGGLRKEGRRVKVEREDDWLQGKKSINTGRPRTVAIKPRRKVAQAPVPSLRLLVLSSPLSFPSGLAVSLSSDKDALWACLGDSVRKEGA